MKTARKEKKHIPLIIGNWKMNPATLQKALELAVALKKEIPKKGASIISIAVPSLYTISIAPKVKGTRMNLCVQNVHAEEAGAHTGEIALSMLKDAGVSQTIVGHSERRAEGETDAKVRDKAVATLKKGMVAIVCIGERARDKEGDYFTEVENQLRVVLKGLSPSTFARLVIAYEPVWAIGTGKHATPEDVQEMKLFIQKVITDTVGRAAVSKIRILYGGSVNKENAQELLERGKADGFLIGGSSLNATEFASIIKIADTYAQS